MKLTLAFSPCPNDTFMFHGIAAGRTGVSDLEFDVRMHDIETLNERALQGEYDITKLSFHAYLMARDQYRLLDVGAALGFGCGPVVVAAAPRDRTEVAAGSVALPGAHTTAHLLFSLWAPEAREKKFVGYDRIMQMVVEGEVSSGVVIHEGRFVFRDLGLVEIADLGKWWEEVTGLPIPLGGIAVRRSIPDEEKARIEEALRESIRTANGDDPDLQEYMKEHAQEMEAEVLEKHVDTFVNDYSLDLGPDGRAAVAKLEEMAREAGIVE